MQMVIFFLTLPSKIDYFKMLGAAHQDANMWGHCLRGVQLKKPLKILYNKFQDYQLFFVMNRDTTDESKCDFTSGRF